MIKNFKFFLFLIILPFIISCSGGGGGGSSADCGTICSEGGYLNEYNNQEGLALIGAVTANAAGYTGNGVKVAVVDSGIDSSHVEFQGKSIGGGSYGGGSGYSNTSDGNGHGTHVASIIAGNRGGTGMRGVAYDSSLYSYRIADDNGSITLSDSSWSSLINSHRTNNIDVSNNSWGSSSSINSVSASTINALYSSSVSSLQNAVASGTIFVWATGNDYRTTPSWQSGMPYRISNIEDGWIAVMAVDHNLQETDYTNRCGVAAAWCVAAPGGGLASDESSGVYAAQANGTYVRKSGTSMAAPHVTGLVATVVDRFPSLSHTAIKNRILTTATYNGLKDTSGNLATSLSTSQREAIFGKGLVTYSAATSTIGSLQYVTGNNYYNSNDIIDLNNEKVKIPSLLANNSNILNDNFTVFDSFDGANFELSGKEIFDNQTSTTNLLSFENNTKITIFNTKNSKFYHPNFISQGTNTSISSTDFWGDKAGFISESNSILSNQISNINYNIIDKEHFNISHFYQVQNNKKDNSIDGYGLRVISELENLSLLSSLSNTSNNLNFSINDRSISNIDQDNFEYGAIYNINDNFDLFYRERQSYLSQTDPSTNSFGLSNGQMSTRTFGVTLKSIENDFNLAFGIFDPDQITEGTISFYKVAGRSPDGSIYYEEVSYDPNTASYSPFFISFEKGISENLDLNFSLQQSAYYQNEIDQGVIRLSYDY